MRDDRLPLVIATMAATSAATSAFLVALFPRGEQRYAPPAEITVQRFVAEKLQAQLSMIGQEAAITNIRVREVTPGVYIVKTRVIPSADTYPSAKPYTITTKVERAPWYLPDESSS